MTKSNKILGALAILGVSAVMASCGGGSGSSGKKLASNEFLGDMPNLVYQRALKDSINDAKKYAEREKFKEKASFDKSDMEKFKKMEEGFDAEEQAVKDQFNADVEKVKPSLVGKDIPFEMEEGCGYEISSLKISGVERSVAVEFDVKITDESALKVFNWMTVCFYFQALDKDGNLIGKDYYGESRHTTIDMSQKNGTTAKGTLYLVVKEDAAEMVNFAKIKFVNKPK